MLEVVDKGSCTEAHPVPLLFVYGRQAAASLTPAGGPDAGLRPAGG